MLKTPKALRTHIGIFGRRNVGKSSVLNTLIDQSVSIVSDVAGTTTDPVEKIMELQPIGPVVFVDTAGIDDVGALGKMRVDKTVKVIERTDIAIIVTDDWRDYESELLALFREQSIPVIIAANKSDLRSDNLLEEQLTSNGVTNVIPTSATTSAGIDDLRQAIIDTAKEKKQGYQTLVDGLVSAGDLVVLVVPIDIEAPKGRLILAQTQTIREVLDENACALVVTEKELKPLLSSLNRKPDLVITDSQAFGYVSSIVPDDVPLTGFSVLFARYKGDLEAMIRGTLTIESLVPGDRILIAEACTHHPIGQDIGRIKIPNWLNSYVGGELNIDIVAGRDFPGDLTPYKLIIHCGACVFNAKQVLSRIDIANNAKVPITNYGLTIAYSHNLFKRALKPFPEAMDIFNSFMAARD
ncbi:MAG: [FeFe] hydrogenase H-cluster maturation GTPase HydF [Anaerohalosphaera sp.]|nr:[FeFe] hydrogenase H-cluster maturation GTPase HydF [Anaerohalosphaera sp.]